VPPGGMICASSLYFPCRTGIWPQRRVRPSLPPPPFGLSVRRLAARAWAQAEKTARFRGVLAVEPVSIRTGGRGFSAFRRPQREMISVANFGRFGFALDSPHLRRTSARKGTTGSSNLTLDPTAIRPIPVRPSG
jgi:hypothetical protein